MPPFLIALPAAPPVLFMGNKSSPGLGRAGLSSGQDAEQVAERAVFLFQRFDAKQKIPRLSSPSFLREITHEASERTRSARGGRWQRDLGAGQSRAGGGRERAAPAGLGRALRGDTAAALPGMPIAASPRQVHAVQKTTRRGKKRENMIFKNISIFFKYTQRKTPTTKQATSPNKRFKTTQPQQRPNLIYLSWRGRLL